MHFEVMHQSVNFITFKIYSYGVSQHSIYLLLRTSHQNQDGKSAIVLRVSFRDECRDIFIGLYCLEMILQSAKNSFVR